MSVESLIVKNEALSYLFFVYSSGLLLLVMADNRKQNDLAIVNTGENQYVIKCRGCQKIFKTFSGRSKHYKSCSKLVETPKKFEKLLNGKFKCNQCDKTISQMCNIYRHINNEHKKTKTKKVKEKKVFNCEVCSKTFEKRSKLIRHENINNPKYSCPHCDKEYKRIDHIQAHQQLCNMIGSESNNDCRVFDDTDMTIEDEYADYSDSSLLMNNDEVYIVYEVDDGELRVDEIEDIYEDDCGGLMKYPVPEAQPTDHIEKDGEVDVHFSDADEPGCSKRQYYKKRDNLTQILENSVCQKTPGKYLKEKC